MHAPGSPWYGRDTNCTYRYRGQFYTRTVLLGGRDDGLGGGRRGATQGLYKLTFPGQPVQAALKQA